MLISFLYFNVLLLVQVHANRKCCFLFCFNAVRLLLGESAARRTIHNTIEPSIQVPRLPWRVEITSTRTRRACFIVHNHLFVYILLWNNRNILVFQESDFLVFSCIFLPTCWFSRHLYELTKDVHYSLHLTTFSC